MNRPPSPLETYNDLDKDVVHFFRVIRDPAKLQELLHQLELTPYSREERTMAHLSLHRPESEELDEIERARRFFVLARQTVRGQVQMQHSPLGIWKFTRDVLSRGMAGTVSSWQYGIDGLAAVAARFRTIQVENYPAIRIIELYDTPDTLFYCLPPHTLIRTADERLVPIKHIQAGEVLFGGRRVLRRMFKMYDGPILTFKAQGLPDTLSMTEDHRIVRIPSKPPNKRQETRTDAQLWSSREVVQARQLVVGDYLLVPLGGTEAIPNWPELNTVPRFRGVRKQAELLDTPELYRFLGYYTAEGHIQRYGKKFASGTILSFNVNELETYASDAAACAYTSFGVEPQFQSGPNPSVVQVCVWSAAVAEFVEQVVTGTATTKRLSPEVMTAPITMQRELLIGWLRGDGGLWIDTNGRTKLTGTTASETLARQMFTIALRCGLRPNFKRRGRAFDVYFASKDASSLGWPTLARTSRTGRRIIQNTMLVRVRSIDEQPYYGPVYDLDVDGDDLFTAPYLLTHNCDPPYVQDTRETSHRRRDYTNEMSDADHRDLAAALHKIKGRAAISGFPSQLYDELYRDWNKIMMPRISGASAAYRQDGNKEASDRIEVLWTNYPLGKVKEKEQEIQE
jgi:site-specific DNA-adenine methylase